MSRPSDLPPVEAFATRPHGTRVRYHAGCRCAECNEANNAYERMRGKLRRGGDWNGLVSAARARRHLLALSAKGVGRRSVAIAAGVNVTSVGDIRRGVKKQIRLATERKILAVKAEIAVMGSGALVASADAWAILDRLLREEGFTRGEIASRLGLKTRALQYKKGRAMRASTVLRLRAFYRELMAEGE